MSLFCKNTNPDGTPEVLIVMPDGKVEFAVTPMQLWSAMLRASKMPSGVKNIAEGRKATDWLAERQGGLDLARASASAQTKAAIEAWIAKHGVQIFAPSRVADPVAKAKAKPAKAKPAKITLSQADAAALIGDLF